MIWFFDKDMFFLDELGEELIKSATDLQELNKKMTAAVTLPFSCFQKNTQYFGYRYQDRFYLYKIVELDIDGQDINLLGVHILYDELQGIVIRDKRPTS